ncbi:MAG: hypothetical protein LBK77_03710 [Spirochaetaceae bacterium]|jgi:hypothetical protein|nr:hypothetical protein [Spirochaetaceae bacterium]
MKKLVTILALVLVTGTALFAQTPAWSWYVSDKGNDNDNNGRSPEQAFRTFQKAFTSAAASNVKTITVVGKTTVTGSAFLYEGSGAAEILLTGQDENAQMDFRLSYGEKAPPSKLRIESLRITDEFTIGGPVNLTLGRDAVFEDVEFKGNGKDLSITMEANAVVRQTKYPYSSVTISEGAFLMKDNALISGAGASVSGVYNTASFAMQDNAKIENSQGDGVDLVRCDFTMMDKASITGCRDTGIVVNWRSTATLQDNASITGCGRTTSSFTEPPLMGGGIRVGGDAVVVLMGNTVISGNKARQGGGIYFTSDGTKEQIYDNSTPTLSRPDDLRKANQRISARYRGSITSLIIQDKVQITGNEAGEGGGIYAVRGSASITVTFTTNDDGRIPKASPAVTAPAVTGVVMNGGTISGNKADYGAGVYAVEALEVEHVRYTPPAQAYGKDFFVYNLGSYIEDADRKSPVPAFTLNGGSVTGNEAQFVGGGVYAKVKGAYQAGRGTLSGNTAGDGEGENLYTP